MIKFIKIFLISVSFPLILAACGPSEQEIKSHGFSNAAEMKDIQAKGFKTKQDYETQVAKDEAAKNEAKARSFLEANGIDLNDLAIEYIKTLSGCAAQFSLGSIFFTGEDKKIYLDNKELALETNNKIIAHTFQNSKEVMEFSNNQYDDKFKSFSQTVKSFTKIDGTIDNGFFEELDKQTKTCETQIRLILAQ